MLMRQSNKPAKLFEQSIKPKRVKTVTIQPGGNKSVSFGKYTSSTIQPNIRISCKPSVGSGMGVVKERLDVPGENNYIILYQFQNFSEKTCRVTIHLKPSHLS